MKINNDYADYLPKNTGDPRSCFKAWAIFKMQDFLQIFVVDLANMV